MKKNWILFLALLALIFACKKDSEPTLTELRQQILAQMEWKGEQAKVTTDVQPAIVLTLAGIDPESLNFELPLTDTKVNFKNDGTWSGKNADNEAIDGTWQLLEDGQKISLKGFQIEIAREELPEDLLAILPPDFDLSLPDVYEIVELSDKKFTIKTSTSRQLTLQIPNGGGTSLNLTINPTVEIFLIR
jgi:hypothetical protein